MGLLEVLSIAVGLSMDAFAVAIVSSVTLGCVTGRQLFRLSFHFGLFQALMPLLGWLAGQTIAVYIQSWDHWLAFGILACLGAKAIYEATKYDGAEGGPNGASDPTKGLTLVALSTATSIDALAVGLSFGMLHTSVAYPVLVIGIVTAALTFVGMKLGVRLGLRFGKRMQILGGCILAGIGIKILLAHLSL